MTNLEWLKKIKDNFKGSPTPLMVKYRTMKGIEIIAEELCKFNAREDNRYTVMKKKFIAPKNSGIIGIEKQ